MKWLLTTVMLLTSTTGACQSLKSGFSYPTPPDSIVGVVDRAAYMAVHFWDGADMTDTALFSRPKLMLDYLYLLSNLPGDESAQRVRHLIDLSSLHQDTFGQVLFWLEHFIYDSSSPYYNEPLYEKAMQAVIAADVDTVFKILPKMRLDILQRNRIGQLAENFRFLSKDSVWHSLYELPNVPIVLMFGNPTCSLCHEAEGALKASRILDEAIGNGSIMMLSIALDDVWDEWLVHDYPQGWLVGIDAERDIYNRALYDIQRIPTFYLLDRNRRVLIKEATVERLMQAVNKGALSSYIGVR